jgi:hypothetical protein
MSTLLGTLLCINGQFQTTTHPRPACFSLPRETHRERPVHRRSASKRVLWTGLAGVTAITALCSLVFFALGMQQVNHTRERIRWSRQLQEREQEVSRLARERQILQGLMAVKTQEWVKPEALPTAYAGTPVRPPLKKRPL